MTTPDDAIALEGGGRTVVHRRGDVVIRDTGPWTPAVHALLRHLERAGFAAPRLVGSGLDQDGREMAWEADDVGVTPDMTSHPVALWAIAWRARSAAWLVRHRRVFETALSAGSS